MRYFINIVVFATIVTLAGHGRAECLAKEDDVVYPVPGTDTAVVHVGLDKDGTPSVAAKEVILEPGQKVLFAGPENFTIIFKKNSPNRQLTNTSHNGSVVISIPEQILEQREYAEELRQKGELRFSYGVWVDGKELDPDIIVRRR